MPPTSISSEMKNYLIEFLKISSYTAPQQPKTPPQVSFSLINSISDTHLSLWFVIYSTD